METLLAYASASAPPIPTSGLVNPPPITTEGLALLDTIFASATPLGFLAPTPPQLHHVSSDLRIAFAQAHQNSDTSSGPESYELTSPTYRAATQLIHSLPPATSQLPQILTQDVISALLSMPPSHTGSVAFSQR